MTWPHMIRSVSEDGSVIPLTSEGAMEYARIVSATAAKRHYDLELRVTVLERELAALKIPADTNWSA